MVKLLEYNNGLRVVVDTAASVRTVCAGIWVGAGSVCESEAQNGIAHFIEHMMFKGTKKMSPFDIAAAFENCGAQINAFTGKENTCFYFKSIDEYAEECFKNLSEIFFDSVFDQVELDKERKVVIEEINMVEDSPEELCLELLAKTVFGEHPLGRAILGSAKNVSAFSKDDILSFIKRLYRPENIVVSFAGNISATRAASLVKKYFLNRFNNGTFEPVLIDTPVLECIGGTKIKDFEQSNICVSFPSVSFGDSRYAAQSVFNVLLGGGMSSRLFQKIREELGLAYSVFSAPIYYNSCGTFNIVVNISPSNTEKTVRALKDEICALLKNGVDENEFTRAKAQLKSLILFGQENVQTRMISLGKLMVSLDRLYDYNERIEQINAVTRADVDAFANEILRFERAATAYVGKQTNVDINAILKN